MCDFSQYGGRSEAWLAVEKAGIPPAPPLPADREALIKGRDFMNRLQSEASARELAPLAAGLRIRDHAVPTRDGQSIEARSYRPAGAKGTDDAKDELLPAYMHMHGGGFVFGSLGSDDAVCARIAANLGVVVLNVNYRHTPEHAYPTAWDDVEDAFAWLHEQARAGGELQGVDGRRVVVGGVSAGGMLAASLTLRRHLGTLGAAAMACPPVAGQVLMIPLLVHNDCYGGVLGRLRDPSVSSVTENADAPVLPKHVVEWFTGLLKVENADEKDLKLNPGNASAEQVKGHPPTTFGVAGMDPLRDEALLYAKTLSEAG